MTDKEWIRKVYLPKLGGKVLYVGVLATDDLHQYVPNPELFETIDIDPKVEKGISPYKHYVGDFNDFKEEYKYDHISLHGLWGDEVYYVNEGKDNPKMENWKKVISMICKAHDMLNVGGTLQIGPNLKDKTTMDSLYDFLENNGYFRIFRQSGQPPNNTAHHLANYNYIFWGQKKTDQKYDIEYVK